LATDFSNHLLTACDFAVYRISVILRVFVIIGPCSPSYEGFVIVPNMRRNTVNLYTEKQVRHILVSILLGEVYPFEGELLPVHDVNIEQESEKELCISIGMDGYKETRFTLPLDEPPVTQRTYMEEVLRTYAGQDTWNDKLTIGALGLAGESGEVNDAIKKWLFAGHGLDAPHLLEEMGDVLWYMALICSAFGWTLDDAIKMNIEKLHKRYPNGFESERSVNRQAYEENKPVPKQLTIKEKNDVMVYMSTTNKCLSTDMPDWLKPLQSIVEDRAFTGMAINLGDVHYIVLPDEGDLQEGGAD
jgi:NTP pyrophosphatase (non-canonical NTP hydrolase)